MFFFDVDKVPRICLSRAQPEYGTICPDLATPGASPVPACMPGTPGTPPRRGAAAVMLLWPPETRVFTVEAARSRDSPVRLQGPARPWLPAPGPDLG